MLTHSEDISDAIAHLEEQEPGSSNPKKILIELKKVVVEELNHFIVDSNFDLNSFKPAWISRITSVMTELNLNATKVRAILCHTACNMQD